MAKNSDSDIRESVDFDFSNAAPGKLYYSTKTYGHERGFSCAFRQWKAESHCRFIHGYALSFKFVFSSTSLDIRNWVVDFGSLKGLKFWLESMFDHTTLVAEDDPQKILFKELHMAKVLDVRMVPSTGCESTARIVYEFTETWLIDNGYDWVTLESVEVAEHAGNSAIYGN